MKKKLIITVLVGSVVAWGIWELGCTYERMWNA